MKHVFCSYTDLFQIRIKGYVGYTSINTATQWGKGQYNVLKNSTPVYKNDQALNRTECVEVVNYKLIRKKMRDLQTVTILSYMTWNTQLN